MVTSTNIRLAVGGVTIDIDCPHDFASAVNEVLGPHIISSLKVPEAVILLRYGGTDEYRFPRLGQRNTPSRNQTVWLIPPGAPQWLPEHCFYWLILPTINACLALHNVVRVHAALLFHRLVGPILIVGRRGDGKSSAAAAWLDTGGCLGTDDTVYFNWASGNMQCFGLMRELHIDPDIRKHLPNLPGLATANDYLPGKHRLRYEWWSLFPSRVVRSCGPPRHILRSHVLEEEISTIKRLGTGRLREIVDEAIDGEPENAQVDRCVLQETKRQLSNAYGWEARWGADVWQMPQKHRGLLFQSLGAGLRFK